MSKEIATTPKQSLLVTMAGKYHMDPAAFQSTIKSTVMPSKATNEQMAAFLLVANEYDLNPITREIHAFPAQGGGVTPVVGIDGWVNLAQRRAEFDGMEFDYEHGDNGKVVSCTCRIYRKDRTRPVEVTEFMDECARATGPWKSHPRRMLRHKAVIQAIRYAFGFSGIKDEDDAEILAMPATPTSKTVADLRAGAGDHIEHQTPDWPQEVTDDETGEVYWKDSRGIRFSPEYHAMGADSVPTVTQAGHFRKRRGCDAEALAVYEAGGYKDAPGDDHQPSQERQETAPPTEESPTYPEVRQAIEGARTQQDGMEARALLALYDGPDNLRAELEELIEARAADNL